MDRTWDSGVATLNLHGTIGTACSADCTDDDGLPTAADRLGTLIGANSRGVSISA